jgi:hypothetical protein
MADRDPISVCTALKEAGASPQAVYEAAKANGLDRIETIRLLRELFGLTLKAAKEVVALVEGPAAPRFAPIETRDQLLKVLGAELGYCDCAAPDTLDLLLRFLRVVRRRSDSAREPVEFASASRELEACLPFQTLPAFAEWFVYGLDQRDLVSHNFRVTDVWITDKGTWLLEALERIDLAEP